jgi:hypothetical protein
MGFLDRIRKGKLYFGKREPLMVVRFLFREKTYILEEFDISFSQDVNERNQPDSDTSGGLISITLSETPAESIQQWIMNPYEKRDGEFRFLINTPKITEGAALHISFRDAYCVSYRKVINPAGAGLLTTLTILPEWLKIGNEEFKNSRKT